MQYFPAAPARCADCTRSLHDALPICHVRRRERERTPRAAQAQLDRRRRGPSRQRLERRRECPSSRSRSEEHTYELQSLTNLVCRLLLVKKLQSDITSRQNERNAPNRV